MYWALDDVVEAGFDKNVGDCIGDVKGDWMARSNGGFKRKEDEESRVSEGWREAASTSNRVMWPEVLWGVSDGRSTVKARGVSVATVPIQRSRVASAACRYWAVEVIAACNTGGK